MEQSKIDKITTINPVKHNTAILKRIELDILVIKRDVDVIKTDLSFIKEYIDNKKEREENKWVV
tara:strand:- start:1322 stop:1513 length:192 start_codon:yes stop_codon:yes gene_type:complete